MESLICLCHQIHQIIQTTVFFKKTKHKCDDGYYEHQGARLLTSKIFSLVKIS
jgi:hypothetical protein